MLDPVESPTANEENVSCINRNSFFMWVLPAKSRWHLSERSLDQLEQSLLHTLAGNIARNRRILAFPSDFVDLVNIDDSAFCPRDYACFIIRT